MTDEREDRSKSIDEAAPEREAEVPSRPETRDETSTEPKTDSESEAAAATRSETETDAPSWTFDEDLERELDQLGFAGKDETIEGEVRGTGEWEPGADITLHVSKPIGEPTFTETLAVPDADEPLTASKFGRLLDARGYDLEQAKHIVGDTVECTYLGEGEWRIVDPKPPSMDSVSTPEADESSSNTDSSSESRPSARRSSPGSTTKISSRSGGSSPRKAMDGRRQMRSGFGAILGALLIPALMFFLFDIMIGSPTYGPLVPFMEVTRSAILLMAILLAILGGTKIALGITQVGHGR